MKLKTLIDFLNDFNKSGEHNEIDVFVAIDSTTTYPAQTACVATVGHVQEEPRQCLVITSLNVNELRENGRVNENTEVVRPELDS